MPNVHHQDEQAQDSVKARAKIKLERDLGPEILAALADPKTVEIMLNSDGKLWQERLGEKMRQIGALSASRSESIIKTIAGFHGKEITKGRPE
jgi:type IV secretion system protein TrbB